MHSLAFLDPVITYIVTWRKEEKKSDRNDDGKAAGNSVIMERRFFCYATLQNYGATATYRDEFFL